MGTLLVTYAIALAAVSAYATWIIIGASRLVRRVKRIDTHAISAQQALQRPDKQLHNAA